MARAKYIISEKRRTGREKILEAQEKPCSYCKAVLPLSEFHKNGSCWDGLARECKGCKSARYYTQSKDTAHKYRTQIEVRKDIERQEKICTVCDEMKPFSEFPANKRSKDGIANSCLSCRQKHSQTPAERLKSRKSALKNKYGITDAKYKSVLAAQGGSCAICGNGHNVTSKLGYAVKLHIDHCHTTGKLRGILCVKCNSGLGHFDDNLEGLMKAVRYLEGVA